MSRGTFLELRGLLMERLDLSRELDDEEILEMIDSNIGKHCARETMTDRKN